MALGNGGLAMWSYDKRLQYPVKISQPNPALAKVVISQFGGPNSDRYKKRFYNYRQAYLSQKKKNYHFFF